MLLPVRTRRVKTPSTPAQRSCRSPQNGCVGDKGSRILRLGEGDGLADRRNELIPKLVHCRARRAPVPRASRRCAGLQDVPRTRVDVLKQTHSTSVSAELRDPLGLKLGSERRCHRGLRRKESVVTSGRVCDGAVRQVRAPGPEASTTVLTVLQNCRLLRESGCRRE
jgi:hypothetical protein